MNATDPDFDDEEMEAPEPEGPFDLHHEISSVLMDNGIRHEVATDAALRLSGHMEQVIQEEAGKRAASGIISMIQSLKGTPSATALKVAVFGQDGRSLTYWASSCGVSKQSFHKSVKTVAKRLGLRLRVWKRAAKVDKANRVKGRVPN